jgi:hypothetical protein
VFSAAVISLRCSILNRERLGKRRLGGWLPLENERAGESFLQRLDAAASGPEIDFGMLIGHDRNHGFIAPKRDL